MGENYSLLYYCRERDTKHWPILLIITWDYYDTLFPLILGIIVPIILDSQFMSSSSAIHLKIEFSFGSNVENSEMVLQNEMEFLAISELIDLTGNLKLLNSHLYRSISLSNSRAQSELN